MCFSFIFASLIVQAFYYLAISLCLSEEMDPGVFDVVGIVFSTVYLVLVDAIYG